MVGWTLRERPTTCSPTCENPCDEPWRKAWTRRFIIVRASFRTDAEQRREEGALKQHPPMVVDLVFDAGIALRVGAGLTLENDRPTVRHDQPVPHQERSRLAEGDLRVVLANQTGALRDEETSGRRIGTSSVTCAVTRPGRSERRPVKSAAGMIEPACST